MAGTLAVAPWDQPDDSPAPWDQPEASATPAIKYYNTPQGPARLINGMLEGSNFLLDPSKTQDITPVYDTPNVVPAGTPALKAPDHEVGRDGGYFANLFTGFTEHMNQNFDQTANRDNLTLNAMRGAGVDTPILQQQRIEATRKFNDMRPYQKAPDFGTALSEFLGSVVGTIGGGATDATSFAGGIGKTLLGTAVKSGLVNAGQDSLSQLFTMNDPTVYNPGSEQYNPNTQEFDQNGPTYVAPGFDPVRAAVSGVAGTAIPAALSGQLSEAIGSAIKGLRDLRMKKFGKPDATITDMGVMPVGPEEDLKAAMMDPKVLAILKANNISPDDPRLAQTMSEFGQGWSPSPNPNFPYPKADSTLLDVLTSKAGQREAPLASGLKDQKTFADSRGAEALAAQGMGQKPSISSAFDPRTGMPEAPPPETQTRFDPVEFYKSGGDPNKAYTTSERPIIPAVPAESGRGTRTQGDPGSVDPGQRAAIDQQKAAGTGASDITPEQKQKLMDAWGLTPDKLPTTVESRRRMWAALEREQAAQSAQDQTGTLRVLDTSGTESPNAPMRGNYTEGDGRSSPTSQPLDRGIAANDAAAAENRRASQPKEGDYSVSGRGDRPFKAEDTSGATREQLRFDPVEYYKSGGNADKAFSTEEVPRSRDYEEKARADYEQARKQSEDDLNAFWEYNRAKRERDAGARSQYEERNQRAEQQYAGAKASDKEKGFDPEGRYEVDDSGFVKSETGGIITFRAKGKESAHVRASRWILKAQKESLDQNFELHNHPTERDAVTVREFSRSAKSGSRGGAHTDTGGNAGAKSDGTGRADSAKPGAGEGASTASEGVSGKRSEEGSGDGADGAREGAESGKGESKPLGLEHRRVEKTDARRTAEDAAAKGELTPELKAAADAADKKAKADFKAEGKPKPGIPEAAKDPNAPKFESFFGFDKKPISADDLTEDGYPKAFGEPGFEPQAKSGNRTTKFYSNPFGDPELWKPIIKDLGILFKRVRTGLGALRHRLRESSVFVNVATSLEDLVRYGIYSNPGFSRSIVDRYRGMGNEKVAKGLEEFINKTFTNPGDGGRHGIVKEAWSEAVEPVVNSWMNRVANVLDPISKLGDKALKEFGDAYQFGGKMTPEMATAAKRFKVLMNSFLADANKRLKAISDARIKNAKTPEERTRMMAEAKDFQIGFIENYLPHILNLDKMRGFGGEGKYLKAAAYEYQRQHGLSKLDADLAAKDYFNSAVGHDFMSHVGGSTRSDTMKSRVFTARRDSKLNEFYVDNPVEALYSYFLKTTRAIAHMERYGVNNELLDGKLTELADLGLLRSDRDYFAGAIDSTVGNVKSNLALATEQAAGSLRLYTSLRFLDQATLSSLAEPISAAARSGDVLDAFRAMTLTMRQFFKPGSKNSEELRNFTEALGITTSAFSDHFMANKFVGGELSARWQRRMSHNFFNNLWLHQLTQAQRQSSSSVAHYALAKWIRNHQTGYAKESAKLALADLGISEDMVKPIADMFMSNEGLPHTATLLADTKEAKAYRTAITRFVNETIMNPTRADRPAWANSPMGGLLFGIASFQAAFTRNVLIRTAKQFGQTAGGAMRGTMGLSDVYDRAIGPAIGLALLSYSQGMLGYVRDLLFNPEQASQRTDEQTALLMFSRAGLLGNLDRVVNSFYGAKYGKDPINMLVGPTISTLFQDASNIIGGLTDDRPNNNTKEWKAAKSTYEALVPFAIGGMITAAAAAPFPVRAGLGMWLLSPWSPGAPQTAVEVANEVAGPRKHKQFNDGENDNGSRIKHRDHGRGQSRFNESMNIPSLISSANADELPAPAKGPRKRKYVISRAADGSILAGSGNSVYSIRKDKDGRISVEEQ